MKPEDLFDFLIRLRPFNELPAGELRTISRQVKTRAFDENALIFRQGKPGLGYLMIIVSGRVELLVTSDRGGESVVGTRAPGEFFGETVVLSGLDYPGSARAVTPLVCILIPRDLLEHLIRTVPAFSEFFSTLLAERMRLLYESIYSEENDRFPTIRDLPLFDKRVGQIMSAPVNCCRPSDQVSAVSAGMAEKDVSSAVVVDEKGQPTGILTQTDMVVHLINRQAFPVDDCRVEQIMRTRVETIPADAFVGQALAALTRGRQKYLLVTDKGRLSGILTAMDLVRSRHIGNLTLLQDIASHDTLDDLARISPEVDGVLHALLTEGARTKDILEVMSGLLTRLTRAVIRLTEKEMETLGFGPPPVEYCWINMGSAARHEQILRTDQDNGIIYADPDPGDREAVDEYFRLLAEKTVQGLNRCGFALCPGQVMASNPKWCRSRSRWLKVIDQWSGSFDPEDTRSWTIFLDSRPVWGNPALADGIWDKIFTNFSQAETSSHMLSQDDRSGEKPVNFLGTIRTARSGPYKDQFNLKNHAIVHLVNGMRLFAVNNGIREPSTIGRLKQLRKAGVFTADTADILETGFETLVMFRIRANVEKRAKGKPTDNYITPALLSKKQRTLLKDALMAVDHMQKLVSSHFTAPWMNFFS